MRSTLIALTALAMVACAQADPDQYKFLGGSQPVYGESNGTYYDATNDYISWFVNDVEVGYIDSSGNLTMDGSVVAQSLDPGDDAATCYGASDDACFEFNAADSTPDSMVIGVGADSNQLIIGENADVSGAAAADLAIAKPAYPMINIHGADATDALDYITLGHDATNGVLTVGQGVVSIPAGVTTTAAFASSVTGADAITLTGAAPTVTIKDNEAAALVIASSGAAALMTFDTQTGAEEVNIVGDTATSVFRVDTGFATFDEEAVFTLGSTNVGPIVSTATAADAITLSGAAPTMTLKDAEAAAFAIKSSGTAATWMLFDTSTGAEEISINGVNAASAFRVDLGFATFDEQAVLTTGADCNDDMLLGGGAGALTFDAVSASVVTTDNVAAGLDLGAAGATAMIRLDTQDNAENVVFGNGIVYNTIAITAGPALDASDCGTPQFITAAHDTSTITLPATIAGCQLQFVYVGADGGALVDISPNASDGVHGSCTLSGSVVEFSGSDNADIGLTKGTANTGDTITLIGDDAGVGWMVTACTGIWANN